MNVATGSLCRPSIAAIKPTPPMYSPLHGDQAHTVDAFPIARWQRALRLFTDMRIILLLDAKPEDLFLDLVGVELVDHLRGLWFRVLHSSHAVPVASRP